MESKYLRYLQKKQSIIVIIILAFLNSVFAITPILVMEKIVDFAATLDYSKIIIILLFSGIYLVMQVIGSVLSALCIYYSKKVSKNVGIKLQIRIYEKLTRADITGVDQKGTLNVSNIILEDTANLSDNYLEPIAKVMISVFSFIMALIYMLRVNWLLTLIVFPLGLVTSIVSNQLQSKMDITITEKRENSAALWKIFNETVFGIKSIRNFGEEAFFGRKVKKAAETMKGSDIEQVKLECFTEAVLSALFMTTIGGILLVSSLFLIRNQITFGVMVAILMYNHMLVDPLLQLVDIQSQLTKVKEAMKRIDKILELPEIDLKRKEVSQISKIDVEHVSFCYPKASTRMEYNINVSKNDKLLINGQSGTGKSTLAKLLMGLYKPEDGKIMYYTDSQETNFYPYIGYLEQDGYLFDTSIRDNIILNTENNFDKKKYDTIIKTCCLHDLIMEYGDKNIGMNGGKLSGGQCKRVLLARTLYRDLPIYIFDEVTSSLDSELVDEILRNLDVFLQDKIVIYIDHNQKLMEHSNRNVNIKDILNITTIANCE